MSFLDSEMSFARHCVTAESPARMALPQPTPRFAQTELVKLCYTLVHAAGLGVGPRQVIDIAEKMS